VVGSLIAAVYFMIDILTVHKTLKAVLGVLYYDPEVGTGCRVIVTGYWLLLTVSRAEIK